MYKLIAAKSELYTEIELQEKFGLAWPFLTIHFQSTIHFNPQFTCKYMIQPYMYYVCFVDG